MVWEGLCWFTFLPRLRWHNKQEDEAKKKERWIVPKNRTAFFVRSLKFLFPLCAESLLHESSSRTHIKEVKEKNYLSGGSKH